MNNETIEVAEVVAPDTTTEQQALVLFELTPEHIKGVAAKYMELTASDKPSYMAVQTAHKEIKRLRIKVQNRQKEIVAPMKKQIQDVGHVANTIINLLNPAEEHLEKEREAYEAEQARLKEIERQRKEARKQDRINMLRDNGCTYTGSHYCIGNVSIDTESIEAMEDELFTNLLTRVQGEYKRIQDEKAEQQRLTDLRNKRTIELAKLGASAPDDVDLATIPNEEYGNLLIEIQNAYHAKQEELRMQEEQRRQEQEQQAKELARQVTENRILNLRILGFRENETALEYGAGEDCIIISKEFIEQYNSSSWPAFMDNIKEKKERIDNPAPVVPVQPEPVVPVVDDVCERHEDTFIEHTENAIIDNIANESEPVTPVPAPVYDIPIPTKKASAIVAMLENDFEIQFPSVGKGNIIDRIAAIING